MIKKTITCLLLILILTACSRRKDIPELLKGDFSEHIISFDETKPKTDITKNNLKEILILLHHRIPGEKIKKYFNLNDSVWNDRINYLSGEGLIKKAGEEKYLPTFFILDRENYPGMKRFIDSLGVGISSIILERLTKVKEAYPKISSLKNISFDQVSMFILGYLIQDYCQEKYFQDQFIKSLVPKRGSANYYYALLQRAVNEKNIPRVYETGFHKYPEVKVGMYSSAYEKINLATYPASILKNDFGKNENENNSFFRLKLINEIIALNKNPGYVINLAHLAGFIKYQLIKNGKPVIPYITKADQQKLNDIASSISKDLVDYFENQHTLFVKRYLNSQFCEETNYKEWMVWVYKLICARAIDELINKNVIIPNFRKSVLFILEN